MNGRCDSVVGYWNFFYGEFLDCCYRLCFENIVCCCFFFCFNVCIEMKYCIRYFFNEFFGIS